MSSARESLVHASRSGIFLALLAIVALSGTPELPWFKGNLHTQSLWSDGDQFPVKWCKDQGYDFVAMSDHHVLADSERWIAVTDGSMAIGRWGIPADHG